jgi:hypothetical protein
LIFFETWSPIKYRSFTVADATHVPANFEFSTAALQPRPCQRAEEVDDRHPSMRGFDLSHQKSKTSDFKFKHALVRVGAKVCELVSIASAAATLIESVAACVAAIRGHISAGPAVNTGQGNACT